MNVAPPVAENFALDGYSYGDTISLQDTAISIAVEFSPAGSVPTSFTATSSDTAVATVAYANGAITITPVADGTATLAAVLNGTDSETYTISVAFPPEPVPTNKVLGYEAVGFFKAKIEEASGGGGFTQLTEADYNATDASGQPCLYIGDLEPGVYFIGSESGWIYGINVNGYSRDRINGTFIVSEWAANSSTDYLEKSIYWMSAQGQLSVWDYSNSNSQGWEFASNSYYADQSFVSTQLDQYVGQLYAQPTPNTYGNTGSLYKLMTEIIDPDTGQWIGNTAEWWLCKGQELDPSTGNSTYEWEKLAESAFTGTDGVNNGSQGLVPAPTTADVNKFLKGDGTWAAAGGSVEPTILTYEDMRPVSGGVAIDLSKLPTGEYKIDSSSFETPSSYLFILAYYDLGKVSTSDMAGGTEIYRLRATDYSTTSWLRFSILHTDDYTYVVTMSIEGNPYNSINLENTRLGTAVEINITNPGYEYCCVGNQWHTTGACRRLYPDCPSTATFTSSIDALWNAINTGFTIDFSGDFPGMQPNPQDLVTYEAKPGTFGTWVYTVSTGGPFQWATYLCVGTRPQGGGGSGVDYVWTLLQNGQFN